MTSLAKRKTQLSFITEDVVREAGKYRRVIIEVQTGGTVALMRLEGTRRRYPMSFGGMYSQAVKVSVDQERAAKKAAQKAKVAR